MTSTAVICPGKVRSAKKILAEKGVYINPVAPYGYQRAPDDKHLLIPDPRDRFCGAAHLFFDRGWLYYRDGGAGC